MRVLVTNDDGVMSPGLHAVAGALIDAGHDVVIVAPARDCSGQSAALGPLHTAGAIEFERVTLDGVDAPAYAVQGPPALCVFAACLHGFGDPPELLVSGINTGANTGRAVLHSGTVGAALTGLNFGCAGVAVSQEVGEPQHWDVAAALAVAAAGAVVELSEPVVINLNVPNRTLDRITGVASAELERGGTVQAALVETESGVLTLRVPERAAPAEGTDSQLLTAGYATLTPLQGPRATSVALDELAVAVAAVLTGSDRLSA